MRIFALCDLIEYIRTTNRKVRRMSESLTVSLQLQEQTVLVFGGGAVAARKIPLFLKADAKVFVVSPNICDSIFRLVKKGNVGWLKTSAEHFLSEHVQEFAHVFLIVLATDDPNLHDVIRDTFRHVPLVLDAARAHNGNISLPAKWQSDRLNVSFSTNGVSPGLAKMIRSEWDQWFHENHGEGFHAYVEVVEQFRNLFKSQVVDPHLRQSLNRMLSDQENYRFFVKQVLTGGTPEVRVVLWMRRVVQAIGLNPDLDSTLQSDDREEQTGDADDTSGDAREFVSAYANATDHS